MAISVVKGQKADLTKNNPSLTQVIIGMGWRNANGVDLDFSAFVLGANGKVSRDEDLIFYGNPVGANHAVSLTTGDKRNMAGLTDREQVTIQLGNVPAQYSKIAFTLTVYEGEKRKQNFAQVDDAYIRIMDPASGSELLRYNLGKDFSVETAVVVGELYRYNSDWKFNAIGSGYSGGLGALCNSFGIEVKEEEIKAPTPPTPQPPPIVQADKPPANNPPLNLNRPSQQPNNPPQQQPLNLNRPSREPAQIPPAPTVPPAANPINLNKIELKKRGDTINLQKNSGSLGEILVNLNWDQKKKSGWFGGSSNLDLDLACLYELKNGSKGVVQALGNSFGSLTRAPYISLDGDDRTGTVKSGENLRINGNMLKEFKRILVFAFIYEGAANWAEANGVVTIKQSGGPDIEVRMDEHEKNKGMCAIALIQNVNDQTLSIEKLVSYYAGHAKMDEAYKWGLRWVAGSK
ncbi:TerD domain-containing protein [Paenibacillus sp. WQ 127069]|uniref:TerD domain-containing protein n=1 Tax=Paenibacillus baimaensis TaxID=2982185 RepID=A0ABT2UHL6_9BACL|nr:TerD domain-containing protein [Paenibacillus sp. WQ 127069]MCU6794129.1 TerD domain-containing protein [Paenibacillus sp. WQ 127069]